MKANDQAAFPDICRFVPILVGKRTTAIKSSINAVKLLRITLAVVRWLTKAMITSRIYQWARLQPDKAAIIGNDDVLSYRDFAHAINSARRFFAGKGLQATQTALVLPGFLLDAWVFVMALRTLGLNTICVQSPDDAKNLSLTNVSYIVGSSANQQTPEFVGRSLGGIAALTPPGTIFTKDVVDVPYEKSEVRFGGHILSTSGTTGTYKQLFLDGKYEDMRNAARGEAYRLTRDTMYHVVNYGLWTTVGFRMPSAVWHVGGSVVLDTRPGALGSFFSQPVNLSILTPSMLKELTHSLPSGPTHDRCELLVTSGFLPLELAKEAFNRVTTKLGISYGSTELGTPAMLPATNTNDIPSEEIYWMKAGLNRTIQVVDESGNECATGKHGELRVKLLDVDCNSYLYDEETSAKVFRDGYFYPGDMSVRRSDGLIRVLGRTADVLNFQGQKVAVAPIELEIQRALGVEEVCLFSGLNRAGKEELVVVIQSNVEPPQDELDQSRERLAHSKASASKS